MYFFFSYFVFFSFFFLKEVRGDTRLGMYWEFVLKQTPKNVVAFWIVKIERAYELATGWNYNRSDSEGEKKSRNLHYT